MVSAHALLDTVNKLLVLLWLKVTVTSLLALRVCVPEMLRMEHSLLASRASEYWIVRMSPASAVPWVEPVGFLSVMPVTVGAWVSLLFGSVAVAVAVYIVLVVRRRK